MISLYKEIVGLSCKLQFISSKWEKRKKQIIDNNYIEMELKSINEINENIFDNIKKARLASMEVKCIAEFYYVLNNNQKCIQYLNQSLDYFVKGMNGMQNGEKTSEFISERYENEVKRGVIPYIAYLLGRYDEIKPYSSEHPIERIFRAESVYNEEDENLDNMYQAVLNHDPTAFRENLDKRIRNLRKNSYDCLCAIDYWSLTLMKFASERGMETDYPYIELFDMRPFLSG